ncbi:MAG: TMAO reductase system periplasmic protein TorT [Pseudodesulfovibrio sp.]
MLVRGVFLTVFVMCTMAWTPVCAAETQWWPIQVKSYYGKYDASQKKPGQASASLKRAKLEEWTPPGRRGNAYTLGVAFPHIKDSYWVAVNYGIIQEAKRLGVGVKILEAGGYGELDKQIQQMQELARGDVDGILVGSISYTGNDTVISEIVKRGVPVVEMINDVHAPDVSAKAMVSFHDMGYYAGEFVAEHAEEAGLDDVRVIFLPGPKNSGWAPETLDGFRAAMEFYPGKVDVVDIKWGDTGAVAQSRLLLESLNTHGRVDYVVGNAVAAEAAPGILKTIGMDKSTTVVSTYIIPSLYDKIAQGLVAAAPSDLTVFQGRMAVNMLVRLLDGEKAGTDFPFRSGPFIPMVTPENISSYPYEGLFGPRNYSPIFKLEPEH